LWYYTHESIICVKIVILAHIWDAFGFLRKIGCDTMSLPACRQLQSCHILCLLAKILDPDAWPWGRAGEGTGTGTGSGSLATADGEPGWRTGGVPSARVARCISLKTKNNCDTLQKCKPAVLILNFDYVI
jgi:hypothetical protein